jgi:Holliday junction resolvase-like predicted endonuclease
MPRPNKQQVARAGEHFVAAELHRRGAYAVTFAGNMPGIDVIASNLDQTRTVTIQVKSKTSGTWHSQYTRGRKRKALPDEIRYWVFVDLGEQPPGYYVVPEWWIENDIHRAHQAYLARHGGVRPRNPDSTHHGIQRSRVMEWRERWDILGLFDT